ncbi:putative ribose-5-phosphate isomerase B [Rickettsiales bacterium Ac37b]|nr:putative ribose-5-phosphate isomerase B [Rickettsiales bacterium Ac37b]
MNYKVAIASDHAGFQLKQLIKKTLETEYVFYDLGTHDEISVDYPDFASELVKVIESNIADIGVLICASGIGMSIAANRNKKIRAALCNTEDMARLAREHNNANILVLGSKIIEHDIAIKCVRTFLNTSFEGGRHSRRIDKLS